MSGRSLTSCGLSADWFLADTMLGALGALLVLFAPHRWLPCAVAAGAALAAGTLAALLLSTTVGLFGFVETTAAQLWWESFWAEVGQSPSSAR